MSEVSRLVLDANIMVSALLGTSFQLFERLVEQGVELFTAEPQLAETHKILSERPLASDDWIAAQLARLLTAVAALPPAMYEKSEARARLRLDDRGQ